jgi:hypothetical protein
MKRSTIAILALLIGSSAAAPALARGGSAVTAPAGPRGGFHGSFVPGGFPGLGAGFNQPRPGHVRGVVSIASRSRSQSAEIARRDRNGDHDRRHHHRDRDWNGYYGYWGYGGDGDGYADTIPTLDEGGYFTSGGEVYAREGARPVYDYDRGYPYEWYKPAAERSSAARPPQRLARQISCASEGPVRVCRGQ